MNVYSIRVASHDSLRATVSQVLDVFSLLFPKLWLSFGFYYCFL